MAENPYVYILVGVMGIVILGHWFPSIKNLNSSGNVRNVGCTSCIDKLERLEQIPGIDISALSVCKQKGLM